MILVAEHVRDITERHLAEEALKESEERFRMLFEYAPDAYFLMDLQGNFLDVNRSTEELTGYGREELIGKNYQALPLFDDRQNSLVAALLAQAVNGKILGPVELNLNRKDGGNVIIEAKGLPLHRKGESLLLGIARDITVRKRAEEALRGERSALSGTVRGLSRRHNRDGSGDELHHGESARVGDLGARQPESGHVQEGHRIYCAGGPAASHGGHQRIAGNRPDANF